MANRQEAEKKELALSIDSFDQPSELSGPSAWAELIANLMFMTPGTIPTDPEMGIDIQQYDFGFIDDVQDTMRQSIMTQVQKYYSDIPLSDVVVEPSSSVGSAPVLVISLIFTYSDAQDIAVVAATKKNNIINYEVVF